MRWTKNKNKSVLRLIGKQANVMIRHTILLPLRTLQLGLAQGLDLADEHVLERVNALACLLNLLADAFGLELLANLHQVGARHLALDDLDHLLADVLDLAGLSISRLLGLVLASLGESNGKATKLEAISRGHIDVALFPKRSSTTE